MPTNMLRRSETSSRPALLQLDGHRLAELRIGPNAVVLRLAATPTADRLWAALPLFSSVNPWGGAFRAVVPIESGRDRTARVIAQAGEVYFAPTTDEIIVCFGATPIARAREMRLPCPCNVWAHAATDLAVFAAARPGEKLALNRLPPQTPARG